MSLVRRRRNNVSCASGQKTAITIDFIGYDFHRGGGGKILVILYVVKRLLDIYSLRTRKSGYLGASGQKSDPAICSKDLDFL